MDVLAKRPFLPDWSIIQVADKMRFILFISQHKFPEENFLAEKKKEKTQENN